MITQQQISRINDALYTIHRDISDDLSARRLSAVAAYSEQHFHRTFQAVTGESVHRYVLRTRLEHAANQLMLDPHGSVLSIATKCGFVSQASFTHAFKRMFGHSPGRWRKADAMHSIPSWQDNTEIAAAYKRVAPLLLSEPKFVETVDQTVVYIRHKGYSREVSKPWQKLKAWAIAHQRPFAPQIGLLHSNPAMVPLEQCRYVACLGVEPPFERRSQLNYLTIPGGFHASFHLEGQYGDLLPWLTKIYEEWLPTSGMKMQTTPPFVIYQRNHFIEERNTFELDIYIPMTLY